MYVFDLINYRFIKYKTYFTSKGAFIFMASNNHKTLRANWYRKGSILLMALAAVVLATFVLYFIRYFDSKHFVNKVPDFLVYIFIFLVTLCGTLVFFYQVLTILTNKMVLSPSGIEIKKFFKTSSIPIDDIIKIDIIREEVLGKFFQNRTVVNIITTRKTYEVNSHEFMWLESVISQWAEENISNSSSSDTQITRVDNITWGKSKISNIRGFLSKDGDLLIFTKYRGGYQEHSKASHFKDEYKINRMIDQLMGMFRPEKELFNINKSNMTNLGIAKLDPVTTTGKKYYSVNATFKCEGINYTLTHTTRSSIELNQLEEILKK